MTPAIRHHVTVRKESEHVWSKKRGPTRPFAHADNCKIVTADPGVEIPWSEVESGHRQAVCACGSELGLGIKSGFG
jgi:hypothetical protein